MYCSVRFKCFVIAILFVHHKNGSIIITSGQSNLTKGRIAAAHRRLSLDTLQCSAAASPQIVPSHLGSRPSSNAWLPEPTRVHNPKGISISSAIFARFTIVTDRQTDHTTSITINRIYVRSTAMRFKK